MKKSLVAIFCLEIIFCLLAYNMLVRPYNGELWINIILWPSVVISLVAFVTNILLASKLLGNRKLVNKFYIVLFVFNLMFPLLLVLLYQNKVTSAV